jgi:hypothetical protein
VTDPGDLRVAPNIAAPNGPPAPVPAAETLLADPISQMARGLYVEPLPFQEDPYAYITW